GANVISLSLGSSQTSSTLSNAVQYAWSKGCVIAAAAGNSGSSSVFYPAGYSNAIAVAATDSSDRLASFSNYGSWVQVAAPGVNIFSTLPTYSVALNLWFNGGYSLNYDYLSGTSMATPHVAGEAGLLFAHNAALVNSDVKSLITGNVDPYTPYNGRTISASGGRLHRYKALHGARGGFPPPPRPPTPP